MYTQMIIIKTKDQKDKEAKLLQELLKTVEECNNIDSMTFSYIHQKHESTKRADYQNQTKIFLLSNHT